MATKLPAIVASIPTGPVTGSGTPDVQPFAITGTLAEPGLPRQIAGWQPNVVPPASQENWFRNAVWAWLARLSCLGMVTQRATMAITIAGTPHTVGDSLHLAFLAFSNDYILTVGDTTATLIAEHWAVQLAQDVNLRDILDFSANGAVLTACFKAPGLPLPGAITTTHTGTTTATAVQTYGGTGIALATVPALDGSPVVVPNLTAAAADWRGLVEYYGAIVSKGRLGAEVSQAVIFTADALVEGIGGADIVNGSAAATVLSTTGIATGFEIEVIAKDTLTAGIMAKWVVKGCTLDNGPALVPLVTNWEPITVDIVDCMIDKVIPSFASYLTPCADTASGHFFLSVDIGADGVTLTGSCDDAGKSPLFTASVRLTQSGIAP